MKTKETKKKEEHIYTQNLEKQEKGKVQRTPTGHKVDRS
jgi:hypothetical protein